MRYKVIGHRASRREGIYENSPQAFAAAARYADGLETDAVLSSDGEIFFVHDMTASGGVAFSELHVHLDADSRARVGLRSADQISAAELRALRLVDGQNLPGFEDLFDVTAERKADFLFDIEIRAVDIATPLLSHIGQAVRDGKVTKDQISILSFDHPELAAVRARDPNFKICAHFDAGNFMRTPIYPGRGVDDRCFIPFSLSCLKDPLLKALNPDFIGLNEYDFRPDVVRAIAEAFPQTRLRIWWCYREPTPSENASLWNTLRALERMGLSDRVAAIITDYPRAMAKALSDGTPAP